MDRFIDELVVSASFRKQILKSNMDRFIDLKEILPAQGKRF